jgi:4-hydroxy-3-methylbut-2-en-1-yl diphosphate reductase
MDVTRSRLVIAAPMSVEAAIVASAARGTRVRRTGMGPQRALAAAGGIAQEAPRALLVLGFCGGLDAESVPGEVIVAEEVYAAEDEGHPAARVRCECSAELLGRVAGRGLKVRSGKIVCVSRLALGERRAALAAAGAIAVDMESVWLAPAAGERPFGVVRVVLDSPGHELLRPQAAAGAVRAARSLRRVTGALHDWAPGG